MAGLGLYIHLPFCDGKCPYCDFYSERFDESAAYAYTDAVIRNLNYFSERFDTVYFGGGTPSLLWRDIGRMMAVIRVTDDAEVTVEVNPRTVSVDSLQYLRDVGVNRLSIGVQSFMTNELRFLKRRHSSEDAQNAVRLAADCNFRDISVDLMLGLPGQTPALVRKNIAAVAALPVTHVSAYMLKIEPGTAFGSRTPPGLPDEDKTADIYLAAAAALDDVGFEQYEISNFSKGGRVCKHNMKYWTGGQYLGIGSGAHSCYALPKDPDNPMSVAGVKRFFVPKDLRAFTKSRFQPIIINEEHPGGFEEFAMTKLRLSEGLTFDDMRTYGKNPLAFIQKSKQIPFKFLTVDSVGVKLTREGFLVSNQIIEKLVL